MASQETVEWLISCTHFPSDVHPTNVLTTNLPNVPQSFQCPAQLFTLHCTEFQRQLSKYQLALTAMEAHFEKMFRHQFINQVAVIGFTTNFEASVEASEEWQHDLLLILFGLSQSVIEGIDAYPKQEHRWPVKERIAMIDKLDLAELLNCSQTIASCDDIDRLDAETRQLELSYPSPSFLHGIENLLTLLCNAFDTLIKVPDYNCIRFSDIKRILLQYHFWVHAEYAQKFLMIRATTNKQFQDSNNKVSVLQLEESTHTTLCFQNGAYSSPTYLLNWYEKYLMNNILGVSTSS